ncbi:MAG: alpha/beta hydrolase domain-containing protein [Longimicrobiales bacterium]
MICPTPKIPRFLLLLLALLVGVPISDLQAKVVRVVVDRREDVLGGMVWGQVGAYEKLVGRIFFAFDPANPSNQQVVDLRWAPRNGDGMVEAWAEFMVLQPKDPNKRRGLAWLEVSNRGGKASLRYFNGASGRGWDPSSEEDFGDGLLLEAGLTIIWVGWQWDVPGDEGLLRLHVPVARRPGGSIQGLVRADWTVDEDAEVLELGHRRHRAYQPVSEGNEGDVLTVRDGRLAPREVLEREAWRFVGPEEGEGGGQITGIRLEGGFRAGHIYELVYLAQDPRVVGLGLAAIRDVMSYAKYDLDTVFPVNQGVAFGVSQTGRFLRHFLYQGFNTDEGGRKAFDGMLIHTAGAGRGSFNHRFGQPSRDAHRYSAFFFPTDLFPFTSRTQVDPVTGLEDGLFARQRAEHLPRVMYTNTGYEYWGRGASLIHTSVDGHQDVEPMDNERIYHLAGGQHFVGAFPPPAGSLMDQETLPAYRGNPLNFLPTLRALAVRLLEWVEEGSLPPESVFPCLAEGTLVPPSALAFPRLPGVEVPAVIHQAYRADYGPRWLSEGVVDRQPPELGPAFPSQVSQVDGLGNELAGLRGVELRVPLATYTPWNLRKGFSGSPEELTDFLGTFIPLSRTEEERAARGDPRPSIEVLYGTRESYLERVRAATRSLVREGFLLPGDAAPMVEEA